MCYVVGAVEADYPEEYQITGADPKWVRELREYQKELAEPGIRDMNYIICAPTGSGKTRAAAYVVYHHLKRKGFVLYDNVAPIKYCILYCVTLQTRCSLF